MPKLIALVACEKIIIGDDNSVSLISIFQDLTITVPVPPEGESLADLKIPLVWSVFSLWRREPGDEGKLFEQKLELVHAGGKVSFENVLQFRMTALVHRNRVGVLGIPVRPIGDWTLKLYIRPADNEGAWALAGEYPMSIVHSAHSSPTQESPKTP